MHNIFRYDAPKKEGIIYLKVSAATKINKLDKFIMISDSYYLKLNIKAVPTGGEANLAIIDYLSEIWGIKKIDLEIKTGFKSKLKLLVVKNIDLQYLNFLLNPYI